jgi:hypothetical protein
MLSVKEADRGGHHQLLYRSIVRELNPDLLDIPFNPHPISWWRIKKDTKHHIKTILVTIIKAFGLYEFARKRKRRHFGSRNR